MELDQAVEKILMDITNNEEGSVSIIECILNGKTFDSEIAEETEIKLNKVRKILYKFHEAGVASYKRTKDPETNWFIYSWKFDKEKVSDIISKKHQRNTEDIEKSIKYEEENMFFACRTNGHRYKFEKASEFNFVCPDCNETLEYQDNASRIVELLKEKADSKFDK
ncbi:transcription factor E [Methanobacterium sp.]|uniref:transcription factor E n=1 Tax=Methanobacterium sp. TaxID=2164 RepID=UPI003C745CAE